MGRRLSEDESDRRYAIVERLLESTTSDLARLHGELALGFRQMLNNFSDDAGLQRDAVWAERALVSARAIGQPDLISTAVDAASAIEIGRDQMGRVLELIAERQKLEDRLSTNERADAWIVRTWAEILRGDLASAVQSAESARAGLAMGQASSFVLGATCWRILALHALGRWDEALADAARAERAWQESELRAPWYAINGFLAAFAIARGRGDSVGADRWRGLVARIDERSDAEIRTRRLFSYVNDELPALARDVIDEFRIFAGRLDYVHLSAALLADRRVSVDPARLDELIEYTEQRGLRLVTSQARRLRGVLLRSREDLAEALAMFEAMDARPFVARVRTELGMLTGESSLVDQGMDELETLGDVEQSARVAAERRAASTAAPA